MTKTKRRNNERRGEKMDMWEKWRWSEKWKKASKEYERRKIKNTIGKENREGRNENRRGNREREGGSKWSPWFRCSISNDKKKRKKRYEFHIQRRNLRISFTESGGIQSRSNSPRTNLTHLERGNHSETRNRGTPGAKIENARPGVADRHSRSICSNYRCMN